MQRLWFVLLVTVCAALVLSFAYLTKSSPLEAEGYDWQDFESAVYGQAQLVPLIPTRQPVPTPSQPTVVTFDYETLLPASRSPQVEFAKREDLLTQFVQACESVTLPHFQAGSLSARWTRQGKPLGWVSTAPGNTEFRQEFPSREWASIDFSDSATVLEARIHVADHLWPDLDFGLYCFSVSSNAEARLKCLEDGCDNVIDLPPGNTFVLIDESVAPSGRTNYTAEMRYTTCQDDCGASWVTTARYSLPRARDIRDYRAGRYTGTNTWVKPCSGG